MQDARCRGVRRIFFPSTEDEERIAKRICDGCPVREQCLAYAVQNEINDGIWGGLTEQERRPPRKRRTASTTGPTSRQPAQPPPPAPACPFCGSRWITPAGSTNLTCLDCNARWPKEVT